MKLIKNHKYKIIKYPAELYPAKKRQKEVRTIENARFLGKRIFVHKGLARTYYCFKYWLEGSYETLKFIDSELSDLDFIHLGPPKFNKFKATD